MIETLKDWFWKLVFAGVLLAWWSLSSAPPQSDTARKDEKGIPAAVWDSTDTPLEIELQCNQTGRFRLSVHQEQPQRSFHAFDEPIDGRRTYSVRIPAKTHVEMYLDIPKVTPGVKTLVVARQGGKELGRDEAELDRPLKPNHVYCGLLRFDL